MLRTLTFEYLLTPTGLEKGRRLTVGDDGRIATIEPVADGPWDGGFALPGMPNAHSHAFQRALVGVPETRATDSFWSWREAMYTVANALEPEDLKVIAARAFTEMLSAGFTSVGEFHYLHHARDGSRTLDMALAVREAAREAGIRMTLLPVLYQRGGFNRPPAVEQRRFIHESLDEFGRLLEQLRAEPCGVAPHSLRAVPPEILPALVALTDEVLSPRAPLHIHVSEQIREVNECRALYGRPPIACLDDSVTLDERWSLVHATHAEPAEIELLHARRANLVLCPLTEAYLGDGLFALPEFVARGGTFAVGSDSNARLDAVEELRLSEYGQRLVTRRRSVLSGTLGLGLPLWREAAETGARALGQAVGRIVPGAFADLAVLDLENGLFAGVAPEQVLDAWVIGGSAAQIDSVYVGGERRVEHGEPTRRIDSSGFASVMRRLHESMRS
ncbi:MAG TPA: formimidoylglutamate deiminase [Steroidobacteraceae bacterium]|nr:formimidoylglutamate deiminase [Steroidobacteraceae bacterium]